MQEILLLWFHGVQAQNSPPHSYCNSTTVPEAQLLPLADPAHALRPSNKHPLQRQSTVPEIRRQLGVPHQHIYPRHLFSKRQPKPKPRVYNRRPQPVRAAKENPKNVQKSRIYEIEKAIQSVHQKRIFRFRSIALLLSLLASRPLCTASSERP